MNYSGQALLLRGILALQQNDFQAAIECLDQALNVGPAQAAMYCNRGIAWHRLGNLLQAVEDYDRAVALDPNLALALANRGVACMEQGQIRAAMESFQRALEIDPHAAATHSNLGNALLEMNQTDAALVHYNKALALAPEQATYHLHRGLALLRLDRYTLARDAFLQALQFDPRNASAQCYLGETYRAQNQPEQAHSCYSAALSLDPAHADAHFFQSVLLLASGDWDHGWPLYEWRWRSHAARMRAREFDQPQWSGQALVEGQRVLVHCEQGLGDTLQFCRYLAALLQRGARVLVEAPSSLLPLLLTLKGDFEWIAQNETLPPFDWHCPLLSLPLALGSQTPPACNAYLQAPAAHLRKWQGQLAATGRRRLGIAWSGNPLQPNDRNRSMRLADLLPYLPGDWDVFVLQTDIRQEDRETLQAHPSLNWPGEEVRDFADSAALCACMDLIVSVDTSVAHLAGALGRPVWVLLAWRADWRWGLQADRTDWYPEARLYRQTALKDWPSALTALGADLKTLR